MAQKTSNSHLHSAVDLRCSVPGKTWFTRNALRLGPFSFFYCFLFVFACSFGCQGHVTTRARKEVLLHRTAGLGYFCVIYF